MMALSWLLDLLMGGGLIALAAAALAGRDHFRSAVLFIIFGLLAAIVWSRLAAPDLALAEAAIGAGLTGALVLSSISRLRARPREDPHG